MLRSVAVLPVLLKNRMREEAREKWKKADRDGETTKRAAGFVFVFVKLKVIWKENGKNGLSFYSFYFPLLATQLNCTESQFN